jgi:predicted HD phosphohydrolase
VVAALIHDIGDGLANARDGYREHPWFDATVEFCERYDENCLDPGYDWLPLDHFATAVEEVFPVSRPSARPAPVRGLRAAA